jgi:hypothetical protein
MESVAENDLSGMVREVLEQHFAGAAVDVGLFYGGICKS